MKLTPLAMTLALALTGIAAAPASAANQPARAAPAPFLWENATVYFLLTDRFSKGPHANQHAYGRKDDAAPLRGFMGGDLAGVTAKIRDGYFERLGVTAIWLTPPVEQIHAGTDEGSGLSYGFHGYWARDWTRIDASLGSERELHELVDAAHARGIRVLLDVVMNHTGPVTAQDPVWPADWVRTGPLCSYQDARTTIECTLVPNLPDVRTDSDAAVALPPALVEKWRAEGRYEREVRELDQFFARTGYPRAPRYYLIKWHADWVRKYGFDGFRADTVKHTEPGVWKELKTEASAAYEDWKRAHPAQKPGDDPFYMTAEVYGYNIANGRQYRMGPGQQVDYFEQGFDSVINFGMAGDARLDYETLFSRYSAALQGPLQGRSVLNYLSSHDDGAPFDAARARPFESANKLLLAPGAAQIYYGDETARRLDAADALGDARLRSFMNWEELARNGAREGYTVGEVLRHWRKLGQFRRAHPAIGAGLHRQLQARPYIFERTYQAGAVSDKVVVALDLPADRSLPIELHGAFADGQTVHDAYSGASAVVSAGRVLFPAPAPVRLIEPLAQGRLPKE